MCQDLKTNIGRRFIILFIYFIYLYTLFYEGKTHLPYIKLFYHVALSKKKIK